MSHIIKNTFLYIALCCVATSQALAATTTPTPGSHTTTTTTTTTTSSYNNGVGYTYRTTTSHSSSPSPLSTGECLNNSADHKCNYQNPVASHQHHPNQATIGPRYRYNNHRTGPDPIITQAMNLDRLDNSVLLSEYDIDGENTTNRQAEGSGTTLRQVIFIHRHGDRTPIQFQSRDDLKNEPFWAFHGYGQLTNRGKARMHLLGKLIRNRYDNFLGKSVNKNQRISRSSGALRCIESAQMFLSGFIGLNLPDSSDARQLVWDQKGNTLANLWQPASIQSVPAKFDGMLAEGAECKNLMDEYSNVIDPSEEVRKIFNEYHHEAEVLNSAMGYEMDHFYKWFWSSSQIEVERTYFEKKMKPEILAIYDRVQEAGILAMGAYQRTLKSKRLRSGLLINDMMSNMRKLRDLSQKVEDDSPQLKKFVHYSAHDLTLVVLLGMLDIWDSFPFRPEYGSNIAIELHQDLGEWFVKIFYMPEVPAEQVELHLQRCETGHPMRRCTLDRFDEFMRPYMIDNWQNWMRECNNDLQRIDPYAPGS